MAERAAQIKGRLGAFVRRRRADARSGSAIVEFALIAPIFFLLLFAILEIGIIFFAQSTLQHATNNLARLVRTGQLQLNGTTQSQMRSKVCTDIAPLIPCDNQLYVDLEAFSNFGSVGFSPPLDPNGNMIPLNGYNAGSACSVVLVRIFYAWPVFTPILTPFLSNMAGDKHLLYAASAFRNEPYTTGLSGC
ncbi:MAG TPA: TadE/TadG family type IV pilus assembly protein [Rhizomicrobium sp.]|nr:TadE/TadG family type IV pilus assembly protein [Rhizomicrobium sp.]